MLTASAEFEFTFSDDSDFGSVMVVTSGPGALLPDAGVGGGAGYELGADANFNILPNSPLTLSPGSTVTASIMFQAVSDTATMAPGYFLGIGLLLSLESPESVAATLSLDGFGAVEGATRIDSAIDTSFSSGTGPFSLTAGNWYQAITTITKETTLDQWTISLDVADFGVTGTSLSGSVYSASGTVSDSATYAGSEYYVAASIANGFADEDSGIRIVQAVDNFAVIPEPGTFAAIFGGIALVGTSLWGRRKRAKL